MNLMTIPFVLSDCRDHRDDPADFSWEPAAGALGSVHLFNFYINVASRALRPRSAVEMSRSNLGDVYDESDHTVGELFTVAGACTYRLSLSS